MTKEDTWKALREPGVKNCGNCRHSGQHDHIIKKDGIICSGAGTDKDEWEWDGVND